jgi:predicted metal-dependent hydrolase
MQVSWKIMFWTKPAVTEAPQEPIWFGGQPLDVRRSPRARSMRLSIDQRTRSVRLTLPGRAALAPALAWAETRRSWAEAQLARLPQPQPIVPGMLLSLGGEQVRLDWNVCHSRVPCRSGSNLQIGGSFETLAARLLRYLKADARKSFTVETRALAARAGVTISAVGVGDPVSRWGSCSATGAIRYSWRLILAPAFVRQAIIAHEVAHRVHMNHGKAFHELADQLTDGDPKAAHRWLKTYGSSLHAFGRS